MRGQCVQEVSREGGDSRKAAHRLEKFNCSGTERNWRVAVGGQGVGRGLLSQVVPQVRGWHEVGRKHV